MSGQHKTILLGLVLCLLGPIGGCARAYHWYAGDCCCTPYDYCPPAPQSYNTYCGCPTPRASCYTSQTPVGPVDSAAATTVRDAIANP